MVNETDKISILNLEFKRYLNVIKTALRNLIDMLILIPPDNRQAQVQIPSPNNLTSSKSKSSCIHFLILTLETGSRTLSPPV